LTCVEKLPHSCGSSDGLQVFLNDKKFDAFCFACGKYEASPYGDTPPTPKAKITKTAEEVAAELNEIEALPSVSLPTRHLRKETLEYFGVKVSLSEQDGQTPVAVHWPFKKAGKLKSYKNRLLEPKKFWAIGDIKDVDLFGWEQAIATGAKRLMITEGEFDAMALYQALKDKSRNTQWADANPAVVSLINGSASVKKALNDNQDAIRAAGFKEVVLAFDMDKAGRKAVEEGMQVIPTATTVTLPEKDANDCVIAGKSLALANAVLFKAERPKNTRIVNGSSLFDAAKKPAEFGIPYPWEGLTKLTRGIRFGETYYIGAAVKSGKSELVNTLATHLMVNHNLHCFLAKPEEANLKTIKLILGKVAGKFFHDPNIYFDEDAWDAAAKLVGDKLHLLDLYQHMGWISLKQDIVAAAHDGCKAVFIDPITNLTNGISAGETNTILQEIAQELSAMAKDLEVVIFLFCHLKSPEAGPPHERGGKVLSSQFAGSRAMARSCNLMLGIECNKDPDLPEEQRNLRDLVILEDREFGAVGKVKLYWDKETGLFNEVTEH
jgi:twinkle protein